MSGAGGAALQQFYTLQQMSWMVRALKTGGVAAAVSAASAPKSSGGPADGLPPPPPPANPPPPPAPTAPSDPTGDARAAAALAMAQLPAPQTSL
jgi:hypothetical protein